MLRNVSWYVFLIVSLVIGLGAFGHGHAAVKVHEAIDHLPIPDRIYQTIFVVWYSVSGTMLVFGAILVWIAFRLKGGDTSAVFVAYIIGVYHILFGVCALIYRNGDPFWALFVVLGVLLIGTTAVLGSNRHKLPRRTDEEMDRGD
jgi:hypothetical protein